MPYFGDSAAIAAEIEEFVAGTRGEPEADRVLATLLFTDIVGSTDRAAEMGDARWRDLLDRHDELCRAEVTRHRGIVVKSTGDGMLARFDGPGRAVICAQATVTRSRLLGIEVRAGVHAGEVELLGDDIAGLAVHVAARMRLNADRGFNPVMFERALRELLGKSSMPLAA